ncbi:rhodanese-like domain-containing protein [Shewanella sp. D64]|uniref:rhodanese-like domain-containing protein n=1 Tax=unclassified Shewanella TaxID=196818 RepID=UPI0022BA3A6B|nr:MULTISPECIES: rhodanese-like domain-containing protein [unclassified Shewanella]MEC4728020.1 rhodanese-like domain-containing protein [Shewanella sp. D64]MEC4740135.1 rhodanese-like domain-containing protein [Shewanella sp. E94]WBJ95197.1 rhodanese-like domain-containing protein [Shewanella sp. MTB7]
MKKALGQILVSLSLIASSAMCLAGGGSEMGPAHRYEHQLNTISMMEAQTLVGKKGVYFFDVNTLELWAEGYIPGAIYFNVKDWKKLLPVNKDAVMVFYCANRLCNASEIAAHEALKLGYTGVRQMPDGIYGWRLANRVTEKP